MNSSKILNYLLYLVLLLSAFYLVKLSFHNGDFKVFLEAAKMISKGVNPYNQYIFITEENSLEYFYSPLWATILIPFSYLPHYVPNMIWLFVNAFFLYRIWILLQKYVDKESLSSKQLSWILFLCIIVSIRFLLYNFELIQMTIFLLWGILESLRMMEDKSKLILGSLILALVINIKIMPVVLIPYLIYRGYFKAVSFTLLFSVLFLLLPALVIGIDFNSFLLSEWWQAINPTNAKHLIETEMGPHSLTALVPTLFTETQGELFYHRNIANLTLNESNMILNGIRLALIILTIYFLKWPPFKKSNSKTHQLIEISYLLLLIPIIFPHQQKYAFSLLIPAQFAIIYFLMKHAKANRNFKTSLILATFILSFILMTLTTDGLIGRELNNITQHYKLITYGALILILPLVLLTKMENENS